jgi:hypothetical protein
MKTIALIICFVAIIVSCKHTSRLSSNEVRINTITLHEGRWISNFKNEVFIRCLNKLLPEDISTTLYLADASSSANLEQLDYDQQVVEVIDSIATFFSKRNENTWTIEKRKVTINVCLSFRNSTELDSLARDFYKKFAKNSLEK